MRDLLRKRLGLVIAAIAVLLFLSANRIATFLTDLWWFDSVGYRGVFTGVLGTRILLGVVFGVVLGLLVAGNLLVARRIRPLFIPTTPQQQVVERYRQMADPFLPWIIAGVAVVFALSAGFAVSAQWEPYLLWRNGADFGVADPQFGRDVSYYVFALPWFKFVQTWLFTSVLLTTLLTAGAHYLLGGIRPENPGEKVMPSVKVHLSVLLALVLAARGWGYWLDRFMLNFSPRGQVTGASYTDVNAELPALNLLIGVTVVAIILTLYNVRRRGFLLPGAAIGLLVVISILSQGAYPAIIQRLRVDPQELSRESEFIQRNLAATRAGFGLGTAELQQFEVANDLDQAQVVENEVTLTNVRLWDETTLATTYAELEALRPYYGFRDVDVDRYIVDGELRQVMVSARELTQAGLPASAQTWQNQTLTFTHGIGVVASQVNTANAEGQPVFLADDVPPSGNPALVPEERAGIYFGEDEQPPYSIVRTQARELDYEESGTSNQVNTTYEGDGGVDLGNRLRRLAFALRFSDPNFVLSGLLNNDSKVLFVRDIQERVNDIAPYLALDEDPYPVVLDGRVLWIVDAYTTSAFYPYSERGELTTWNGIGQVNYIRNSVKAVVDAYSGQVTLYQVDTDDPISSAWRQAFPGPFADLADAPEGLEEHFRYPQDLFRLQTEIFRDYHIPGVEAFYSKADSWDIPRDAAALANNPNLPPEATPLEPYYLLMRLPGETDEEFVLIQPYLARGKPNMIAWLAGRSDPGKSGDLLAVQFPSDQTILGPQQAEARIEQSSDISEYITLRDQAGSNVIRGNLLVIPIEKSILYVQPLFLESPQARIPELDKVVVVMGNTVSFEDTLVGALADLVGAPPPPEEQEAEQAPTDTGTEQPSENAQTEDERIMEALEKFADAQTALDEGNLGEYQSLLEEAQQILQDLADERGISTGPPPVVPTAPPTEPGATEPGATEPAPTTTESATGG